jgi:hypothetical protein
MVTPALDDVVLCTGSNADAPPPPPESAAMDPACPTMMMTLAPAAKAILPTVTQTPRPPETPGAALRAGAPPAPQTRAV